MPLTTSLDRPGAPSRRRPPPGTAHGGNTRAADAWAMTAIGLPETCTAFVCLPKPSSAMTETRARPPQHSAPRQPSHQSLVRGARGLGGSLRPRAVGPGGRPRAAVGPGRSAPGARPKPARADSLAGREGRRGRGALAGLPHPCSYRTYFASSVAVLSSDSSGPRQKNRDQTAANTIAPRMNVSTGSHDARLLSPVGIPTADCTTKWPT